MSDRAFRFVSGFFFLAAAIAVLLLLTRCAPDPYEASPVHAGQVIWKMVPADQVPAECGHPEARWIKGCSRGLEIVTRIPQRGDGELAEILEHEVAHAQGFHHPAWPDGTP
jgi:hypothetical protein